MDYRVYNKKECYYFSLQEASERSSSSSVPKEPEIVFYLF